MTERTVEPAIVSTHVAPARGYGGVAESTARLALAWAASGHRFRLCASDASLGEPVRAERIGLPPSIPVRLYRALWLKRWGFGPGAPWAVLRVCLGASHIYVRGIVTWPTVLGAMTAILLRKPPVVATHGGMMPWADAASRKAKPLKWLYILLFTLPLLRRSRLLHATSEIEAAQLRRLVPDTPVIVVPHGMELSRWPKLPPREADDGLVCCYVGRFSREKGIRRFLEIWLARRGSGDRLILAGSGTGPYAEAVKELAAKAGGAVTLLGYVDAGGVRSALAESDFLVLPSGLEDGGLRENFGNAAAEALASGRPVLVPRGLAWDEVEKEGCGFLFDGDAASVTAALARARALSPAERAAMSAAARRFCESRLDMARIAELLWRLVTGAEAEPEIG